MRAHQAHYPVATQCRLLDVSTSGYYAWQRRGMSARAEADRELLAMIQAIHAISHGTYGAPRIHAELGARGVRVGRKRVARLMRSVALAGVSRRKRPHTTVRSRGTAKAPDLVQRQFTAEAPDRLWVADITYVPTRAGFLYLAVVVDVFSRRVVGWAMESHLRTELVLQALNMALYLRRPQGVIHHSDQGIQYTAYAFGKRCSEWGVRPSMGSVGDCYDNALCESFFASLECELLDRRSFQTHAEARMAVFQYIEGWYNTHRRHSSIGYYAPIAFERRYTSSIQHVEPLTVHQIGATPLPHHLCERFLGRLHILFHSRAGLGTCTGFRTLGNHPALRRWDLYSRRGSWNVGQYTDCATQEIPSGKQRCSFKGQAI